MICCRSRHPSSLPAPGDPDRLTGKGRGVSVRRPADSCQPDLFFLGLVAEQFDADHKIQRSRTVV